MRLSFAITATVALCLAAGAPGATAAPSPHTGPSPHTAAARQAAAVDQPKCKPAGCQDSILVTDLARKTRAVKLLKRDQRLISWTRGQSLGAVTHTVVTRRDLRTPAVRRAVRAAYTAGFVVAVTDIRAQAATRLAAAAGSRSHVSLHSPPGGGQRQLDPDGELLVIRRYDGTRAEKLNAAWIEPTRSPASGKTGRDWLTRQFTTAKREPLTDATNLCTDPATCLQDLSQAKVYSAQVSKPDGNLVELENQFYAVRSFAQGLDYYYVQQTVLNTGISQHSSSKYDYTFEQQNTTSLDEAYVTDITPASTQCTQSFSTSTTHTVGGTAGFSGGSVSETLNLGSQYGSSTQTACPNLQVTQMGSAGINTENSSGVKFFKITVNPTVPSALFWYVSKANANKTVTFTANNAFVLTVPVGSESGTTLDLLDTTAQIWDGELYTNKPFPPNLASVTMTASSQSVDFPFPTTSPQGPKVSEITDVGGTPITTIEAGEPFQIQGSAFYPGNIVAITVGGLRLPSANVSGKQTDTTLGVDLPATLPMNEPLPVVVATTYGISNANKTIELVDTADTAAPLPTSDTAIQRAVDERIERLTLTARELLAELEQLP